MDRNEMGRRDRAALRQVIALLLSMADLAQAACGRSAPVRWLVLLILGSAEAVARDYVAGMTGVPALTPSIGMAIGPDAGVVNTKIMDDSIARAMRLSSVFRALAAALSAALAVLLDKAATPAHATAEFSAFRDLLTGLPVERRDSS